MIDDRDRPAGAPGRGTDNQIDDDPLAELIRIVKEEDPFSDVLAWQPGKNEQAARESTPEAGAGKTSETGEQAQRQPRQEQPARHDAGEPPQPAYQADPAAVGHDDRGDAPQARRRGPPPLEPIALEEALREFREVPEDRYAPPRDEYDPAAIPDDGAGHAEAAPDTQAGEPPARQPTYQDETPAYQYADSAGQAEHAGYDDGAQEHRPAEAYFGDVIQDEEPGPYEEQGFASIGTDDAGETDDYATGGYAARDYDDDGGTGAPEPVAAAPMQSGTDEPRHDSTYIAAAEQQPARGRRGIFFGAGVLLGFAVLAGLFITVFQTGGGAGSDGPLPVVRASDGPAKVAPDDPGGANIPNQERLVYNRVSGEEGEPDTRLVSREEEVMEQGGDKAAERFPGLRGGTNQGEAVEKVGEASIPSAMSPGQSNSVTPQPRRVRTLTVGPDGSLSPAPREEAPVANTARAEPEPAPEPEPEPAPAAEPAQADAQQAQPAPPPARASVTPTRPAQSESQPPARSEAPPQPAPRAAEPAGRTQGAPLALNPNRVPAAQARPAQAQPPAARQQQEAAPVRQQVAAASPATSSPPAVASQGDYVVQLAARKSEEQALGAYDALQGEYSGLLGRYQPLIQRADLGDRGVYYRVRVGPMANADSANQLCEQLKSAGLSDCLVRRR